jgi:hypothetical protein
VATLLQQQQQQHWVVATLSCCQALQCCQVHCLVLLELAQSRQQWP